MHQSPRNTELVMIALVAIFSIMPLMSGCSSSAIQNLSQTCYGNGSKCLTYTTWGKNIDAAINGKAVGYAYVILHNGIETQAINSFGQARTAADSPTKVMSINEPSNIASVTKTLTAAAVLHLLATKHISVNSGITPYLPPSWQLGQNVNLISFSQLLTHTSGIQAPNGFNGSYSALKTLMGQNIDVSPTGYKAGCLQAYNQGKFAKCYQNANFALFRIIIPYILGPANPYPPSENQYPDILDPANDGWTAQDYLSYMNSVYGSSFSISCTPQGSARMLSYLYPGGGSGTDWGDWWKTCGHGGIQLSATDMAAFLSNLTSGSYVSLTPSSNPDTPSLPAMVSNMYGWDYRFPNTTYGICIAKNGDLGFNNSNNVYVPWLTTLIVYCPQTGLAFAGLANSRLGTAQTSSFGFPGSWDDIVINAYNASWK